MEEIVFGNMGIEKSYIRSVFDANFAFGMDMEKLKT